MTSHPSGQPRRQRPALHRLTRAEARATLASSNFGPFHIRWQHGLVTAADSLARTTFRFKRGDEVVTPRGRGSILQAYASGPIIEYDIQMPDGRRVMVHQRDLRRP